jgi:flagellar basal body-associated protein FliL
MRRRQILAALPFALAAGAAAASETPARKDAGGQYVDLAPVALPIVLNNRLINYVFVSIRINLSASADAAKMREKEPWFRDALVRTAHRTPFTKSTNYTVVDDARLKAALMRDATAIVGARNLASVTITSQTPKQRSRLPRPPAA